MASPKAKRNRRNTNQSLTSSRPIQIFFFAILFSSVYLLYKFSTSKVEVIREVGRLKENVQEEVVLTEKEKIAIDEQIKRHREEYEKDFHLLMMFTNVQKHPELKTKLTNLLDSMVNTGNFNPGEMLHIHFVSDDESQKVAKEVVGIYKGHISFHIEPHFHNSDEYAKKVFSVVEKMQKHFGNHAYYQDAIFFLSMVMHRILPEKIHRVVQLDLDLKINTNIRTLWDEFDYFTQDKLIGLAHENQPVYRHLFWRYRKDHPGTAVGSPLPGNPGFNSGVILLHLDHMRHSELYNDLLEAEEVGKLATKYDFKGHLGDQDFFTLLSLDHSHMFHVLDCTWNRQLCQWWKSRGYEDIFDEYYTCNGEVKIWHGNCNTPIP